MSKSLNYEDVTWVKKTQATRGLGRARPGRRTAWVARDLGHVLPRSRAAWAACYLGHALHGSTWAVR